MTSNAIHKLTAYMKYLALYVQFNTHLQAVVPLPFLTKIMFDLHISPWLI